jgi:hypothetical protein
MAKQLREGLIKATGSMSPRPEELGVGAEQRPQSARGPPLMADYISEHEAAPQLGQKVRTLRLWRAQGIGPPWIKIGKLVFYSRKGFGPWFASLEHRPVRSRNSAA